MSTAWDDFEDAPRVQGRSFSKHPKTNDSLVETKTTTLDADDCDWGINRQEDNDGNNKEDLVGEASTSSSRFISVYESYLQDKEAFSTVQTKNHRQYKNNPQKALRDWFENEGNELTINTDQQKPSEIICSLDIPIEEHDFTITSEVHKKKQAAIDEICLVACKLLDESQLLYSNSFGSSADKDADQAALAAEKKRQFSEANKEDDIELDNSSKRHCDIASNFSAPSADGVVKCAKVNTYESLMADWRQLNMSILTLKAKLVKLDLSVCKSAATSGQSANKQKAEDEAEADPLDEFMSSLNNKTQLSMDEKIEKTRIKTEIASLEGRQAEVAKLIELAKPKFDFNKATANKVNRK